MTPPVSTASTVSTVASRPIGLKVAVSLAGAIVVAAAAQVAIPVLGSPVPFTLQPLAVLIVGGLLGPRFGALSLVMYLAMGAAGLPVFTPIGLPGFARLTGPTGGYLIAYPLAAAVTGWAVRRSGGRAVGAFGGAVLGILVIHAGGLAQLMLLTGSASRAFAAGLVPFIVNDLVKAILAALVIRRFAPSLRALG